MSVFSHRFRTHAVLQRHLDSRSAPAITECKETYWGRTERVACRLVHRDPNQVVLFHALDASSVVDGTTIGPPMFTIAFYWRDRPYNLYCWVHEDGSPAAVYFNVVATPGFRLAGNTLRYRDLVLDVFVRRDTAPRVLDEAELADVDVPTREHVTAVAERLRARAHRVADRAIAGLPTWVFAPGSGQMRVQ